MENRVSARPAPLETHVGLLPDGKCVVVRHWNPIDAGLREECDQCVAQATCIAKAAGDEHVICVRAVRRSRLYAECFGE